MKKKIVLALLLITTVISGWLIINQLDLLDIPSNKNDHYAAFEKRKIDSRTDINDCEKELLKSEIDINRKNTKQNSIIAYNTQIIAFIIIGIQVVAFILVLLIPKSTHSSIRRD